MIPTREPSVKPDLSEAKRRLLAQRLKGVPTAAQDRIQPRPADEIPLIAPEQYSIWLDATLQPDQPTYNEPITVQFRSEIDPLALERALNAFIARHEAWRTGFVVQHGEVVQEIASEVHVDLPFIDLGALPATQREAESQRLATQQAIVPLNLERSPLLRALLVRLAPDDTRLHLVLHHLIFDGFSVRQTFLPELAILYQSFTTGSEPALPPITLQYSDYTTWRRQQADSPTLQHHLDYWRQQLAGELPILRLPSDRPRPATMSHRGGVVRFSIPRDLTRAVRAIADAQGASLYMALLATFQVLLFRYSAQQDIIVGSVANARRRPELEAMMGYILDVFAVRTFPASALPFTDYLKQTRRTVLDAFAASELPFEHVVSALGRRRDSSHQPVFQTVFVFQPTLDLSSTPWEIGATEITTGAAKFDLYVEADEKPTHTAVRIFYSTDLFDAGTIDRMAGHWLTLLEAIVRAPETPLGALPLLTPEERETILVRWNDNALPIPETTFHHLVEAQALSTPDAPAVRFEDTTFTYAQLDREASRIAQHLALAGAAPKTLAAVFLDRSQHLVAGLLGVLKTGAAYMPLDPGTPAARIALCLEDAPPTVILTERSRVAHLPSSNARILLLEDILSAPEPAEPFVTAPAAPDDLAYVIHTSGSTGRPKGVELRHHGVVNLLLSMQRAPGLTVSDTLIAITTVSFDIAVLELFLPLITGAQVVIASREIALDPARLAELISSSGCTVLQATPATWSALLGIGWSGKPGLKALCGGEALNRSLADRLLALKLDLWNVYGPTETTIWSTVRRVRQGPGPISIGRPIANTTTYILDAHQQAVPIGVSGELYLGGVGLARGYRNKPELTAARFVTPAIAHGERLYRTGDYALYRSDGALEVQGRADNQVKIRGYRVELEDVEVNLAAHPQVALAAATAWPDPEGGYRLAAYLVGVGGIPPTPAELRQFLRGRIAPYMVPSDIIALDAMPLTSNGKVDRKQLPQPIRTEGTILNDTPLQGEELRLATIWSELLQVESISATDNFFDLGGHSLMLLKLIRMINKEFAVELPITQLFQAPTIEKLAPILRELTSNDSSNPDEWNTLIPLNPKGTKPPFFLIHSIMLYGRLPAALGDDQPFYGLQTLPFEDYKGPNWVDDMLEDHIAQIKRVQPHGPYQLAGWCFAGLMAYEIARRLESRGDTISTLALLDSWCPFHVSPTIELATSTGPEPPQILNHGIRSRLRSLLWKVDFRFRQFVRLNSSERWGHIHRMFLNILDSAVAPIRRGFKARLYRLYLRFNLPRPRMLQDSWVVTYEWLRKYRVQPYHGDISLVRPADIAVPPDSDPNCGWRTFTSGNIRTTFVPGDRSTMFLMPNLDLLAEVLRNIMNS